MKRLLSATVGGAMLVTLATGPAWSDIGNRSRADRAGAALPEADLERGKVVGGLPALAALERTPAASGAVAPANASISASEEQIQDPGFELGAPNPHWDEYSEGGYEIVSTAAPYAGSYSAYLCGYDNCYDDVWQGVSVPVGVQSASLSFYLGGFTQEETAGCYDTLSVALFSSDGASMRGYEFCEDWADGFWRSFSFDVTSFLQAHAGETVYVDAWALGDEVYVTDYFVDAFALNVSTAGTAHSLSVSKTGPGTGSVTSSPAGISCGTDCSESFAEGTPVTLSAAPGAYSRLESWSGCDAQSGDQCTVAMSSARSVTAAFAKVTYGLDVTVSGAGAGTVTSSPSGVSCGATCSGSFEGGSQITLTARHGAGSVFTSWAGACAGTQPTCEVTMTQAQAVSATFEVLLPSITDIAGDANLLNGQGAVDIGEQPSAPASYGPMDIRAVRFETTYQAVPVGDDGVDYQATGLTIHYRTEAIPMSDGPTLIYRVNATVDGCGSFLQGFLRGASSTPLEPADRSVQWRKLDAACPGGIVTSTNAGWTVTVDATAKELVMSIPYSKLTATELPFMDEGSVLSALVANTRTYIGSETAPQFDESPLGEEFEIGSDMPEDVPCTASCPGAAQQG